MLITNLGSTCEYIKIQFDSRNYIAFEFNRVNLSCIIVEQEIKKYMINNINARIHRYDNNFSIDICGCPDFSYYAGRIYLRGGMKDKNNRDMLVTYKGNSDNYDIHHIELIYNRLYKNIKFIKAIF